jgi:hypothetical protein
VLTAAGKSEITGRDATTWARWMFAIDPAQIRSRRVRRHPACFTMELLSLRTLPDAPNRLPSSLRPLPAPYLLFTPSPRVMENFFREI